MTFDRDFLTSPTGQVVLVAAVLLLGVIVAHRYGKAAPAALPAAKPAPAMTMMTMPMGTSFRALMRRSPKAFVPWRRMKLLIARYIPSARARHP